MNKCLSAITQVFGVFAACTAFGADPLVVDLWPGKTPGDVGIKDEEYSRIYQSPILGEPTKLITNVSKPTVTIYQPMKDKNTGTAMLICPGGGYHNLFWELEVSRLQKESPCRLQTRPARAVWLRLPVLFIQRPQRTT